MSISRHPEVSAAVALVLGVALTALTTAWQARKNAAVAGHRFDAVVARTAEEVTARLRTYEYSLRGARGAVLAAGVERIDAQRYHEYSQSRDILREFPGARGIGVIRRVAPANELAFLAAARREGRLDFAIRQLAPHDGERYVIQYIEPTARNEQALGLDVASEENRRTASWTAPGGWPAWAPGRSISTRSRSPGRRK